MTRLRAHFDGRQIVLDEPAPEDLRPDTPIEVLIPDGREAALLERQTFFEEFWTRPVSQDLNLTGRTWKREDLYERGRKPLFFAPTARSNSFAADS